MEAHEAPIVGGSWAGLSATVATYGLCECGCGEHTPIASVTSRKRGWVKGMPIRFVRGHSMRITNRTRRGVERVEIVEQDRGFWSPCLVWMGALASTGYGSRGDSNGRIVSAHRFAYEREHGAVPKRMELHHLCRIRTCVNPEHLIAVTRQQHVWLHRGDPA